MEKMKSKLDNNIWQSTLLKPASTIQQAIYSLEKSGMQIVMVVSEDNKLVGTLTDGDIRRALLKGCNLDSYIDEIIHRNPLVIPPGVARELILQLMQANVIRQLPMVDENGSVVGLYVWDSIIGPTQCENIMVIMAGGQGARLHPHTENCPKPMLEVGGKPILQHIIERASRDGFHNFTISLYYLGEMIEEYFGRGDKFGVNIQYLREQTPLGTAGCLSLFNKMPKLPFVVTNGDVLTDINYGELLDFHIRHSADATMAVRQHEIQNQFGVVKTSGIEIEGFEEKPIYRSHVNAGIYILNPESLNLLAHGQHCDMPTLFERLKDNSMKTIAYPMHEPWLDVGRPEDLLAARKNAV
jgi:dTDP-glucose pyrophosphorylase